MHDPDSDLSNKYFYGILFVIFLLAILTRLFFLFDIQNELAPKGYMNTKGTDMQTYVEIAHQVIEEDFIAKNSTISPLAPLVTLPLFFMLSGDNIVGAMVIQIIMSAACVLLIALIGTTIKNRKVGLLAALLASLYYPFIIFSAIPLTETTIDFFFLLTLYNAIHLHDNPAWKRFAILGLSLGLAAAAKPTMIILLPVFAVFFLWKNKSLCFSNKLKKLAFSTAIICIVISPFIWRAYKLTGNFIFMRNNTAYMVLMGNYPGANGTYSENFPEEYKRELSKTSTAKDIISAKLVIRFWKENTVEALKLLLKKIMMFFSPKEIANNISFLYLQQTTMIGSFWLLDSYLLFPFAFLGLIISFKDIRRWAIPLIFAAIYSALIITTIVLTRLRFPVVWVMILLSANSLIWIFYKLFNSSEKAFKIKHLAILIPLLLLILIGKHSYISHAYQKFRSPYGFKIKIKSQEFHTDGSWDLGFPYRTQLSSEQDYAQKIISVPQSDLSDSQNITVAFRGSAHGDGHFLVTFNNQKQLVKIEKETLNKITVFKIDFKSVKIKPNNLIQIKPVKNSAVRICVGDDFWFGRSRAVVKNMELGYLQFDQQTARHFHGAHLPRGELMIGFAIRQLN